MKRMSKSRKISWMIVSLAIIAVIAGCSTGMIAKKPPKSDAPPDISESPIAQGYYKVTQGTSTFREPDLGSQTIERIEPGSIVEVVDAAGAFAQIKFSENAAWLRENQIEETDIPDVVRTLGRIRAKEGPSELSRDMEILDSGRLLTVKMHSGDWVLVKISENLGWLLRGALEPLGVTTKTSILQPTTIWEIKKRANMRSRPSLSAEILKTIPVATEVGFLGKEGEWVRVSYRGLIGYIHEDLVEARN